MLNKSHTEGRALSYNPPLLCFAPNHIPHNGLNCNIIHDYESMGARMSSDADVVYNIFEHVYSCEDSVVLSPPCHDPP